MKTKHALYVVAVLLVFHFATSGRALPIVVGTHPIIGNDNSKFPGFESYEYIKVPIEQDCLLWKIQAGILSRRGTNGVWMPVLSLPAAVSEDTKLYTDALGAPGLAKNPIVVQATIDSKLNPVLQIVGNSVVDIGLVWSDKDQRYKMSIYQRGRNGGAAKLLSSFILKDEIPVIYRLTGIIPLSSDTVGIVLATPIRGQDTMVFYDLRSKQPAGFVSYSVCQYLPFEHAIWFAPCLPGRFHSEAEYSNALNDAKKMAKVVPIWVGGRINSEFTSTPGWIVADQ
jgi:hypothetical protein